MKKYFILLFIVLFIACTKQQISEPIVFSKQDILYNLNTPYKFNINIRHGIMTLNLVGQKDALGKMNVSGEMNVDGEKIVYNTYYDGKWYDAATGEPIIYDSPINPDEFIRNALINDSFSNIELHGKKGNYNAMINTVFITPFNYERNGKIVISKNGFLENISVNENNFTLNINIKYSNNIIIKPKRKAALILPDTFPIDNEIIKKRLELTGIGTVNNGRIELYEKNNEYIEMLFYTEAVYIGHFDYTEPLMHEHEKYFYGNLKNTAIINDTIYTFNGNELLIPQSRGPFIDIIIEEFNIESEEKFCVFTYKNLFRCEIFKLGNYIKILKIQPQMAKYLYSIIKYPEK